LLNFTQFFSISQEVVQDAEKYSRRNQALNNSK